MARQWLRDLGGYARSVPISVVYLLTLALTTLSLSNLPPGVAHRLLLAQSTNLHHLEHSPLRVLVASAFWLADTSQLGYALVACIVLSWVEHRFGSRLWAATFVTGHVVATLITVAAIWIGLKLGYASAHLEHAKDVGPSYGLAAVAALFAFTLPLRWRYGYGAALVGYAAIAAGIDRSFTSFGHLIAIAIGFAIAFLARDHLRERMPHEAGVAQPARTR